MRASINEALNTCAPAPVAGDILTITERVCKIRAALSGATEDLTTTRNRVFGAPPEVAADASVPTGWGDLGVLNSALDVLEHEVGRVTDLANVFGRL